MAITITRAQVKAKDTFPTSDDSFVDTLISAVTTFVENYLKRTVEAAAYDEYYDGDGSLEIHTKQFPINSVSSLTHEDENGNTVYTWTSVDYAYESQGLIKLRKGKFPKGIQNIRIQYNAGYTTLPKDLEDAVIDHILWKKANRQGKDLGLRTKSLGDGGYQIYQMGIPDKIKIVYDLYRRFGT
ncbi:MAG: hypothetical protein ACE5HR_00145 [bacterium]